MPDQGARLEYEIGGRIELSRPHAKLGILTAQRKVVVGSPDAGVENTNAVKDLAAKTHAAKQITDSADTCRKPGICASNDPHKFVGKPGRAGPAPEGLDPTHDPKYPRAFADRLQGCEPRWIGDCIIIEERNHPPARDRDAGIARS